MAIAGVACANGITTLSKLYLSSPTHLLTCIHHQLRRCHHRCHHNMLQDVKAAVPRISRASAFSTIPIGRRQCREGESRQSRPATKESTKGSTSPWDPFSANIMDVATPRDSNLQPAMQPSKPIAALLTHGDPLQVGNKQPNEPDFFAAFGL